MEQNNSGKVQSASKRQSQLIGSFFPADQLRDMKRLHLLINFTEI